MKKMILLLLILVHLLTLSACAAVDEPPATTTAPTSVPTTGPTTEPPTTAPTEPATQPPTEPAPTATETVVSEWAPLPYESLSYSEYLSESRSAFSYCIGLMWTGQDGETEYFLDYTADGWDVFNRDEQWPSLWTIPGSDSYSGINLMLCDGEWAYGTRNQTEMIRVELLTGNIEVLFTADRMMCWPSSEIYSSNATLVDRDWLYFLAKVGDTIGIYRLYLPEMRFDLLCDDIPGDTMPYALDLEVPSYTNYTVSCVYLSPEIQTLVLDTLANADSPYKNTFEFSLDSENEPAIVDLSPAWDVQDPESSFTVPMALDFLVVKLQQDYDILGKRIVTYYEETGEITDTPGWAKPYGSFAPYEQIPMA